ncbi:MAG: hypothetical protein EA415_10215 [Sphaerobacteraceae bacterium]|nr:MAG: hypothetical protein EA415_10215 [Sphaerobacteraceae bacterium]
MQLLHSTNTLATDASNSDDAIALAIREVCKHLEFDAGHACVVHSGDVRTAVPLRNFWYLVRPDGMRDLVEA